MYDHCAHTFDIIYAKCRLCTGRDKTCRCFETHEEMHARLEEAAKGGDEENETV